MNKKILSILLNISILFSITSCFPTGKKDKISVNDDTILKVEDLKKEIKLNHDNGNVTAKVDKSELPIKLPVNTFEVKPIMINPDIIFKYIDDSQNYNLINKENEFGYDILSYKNNNSNLSINIGSISFISNNFASPKFSIILPYLTSYKKRDIFNNHPEEIIEGIDLENSKKKIEELLTDLGINYGNPRISSYNYDDLIGLNEEVKTLENKDGSRDNITEFIKDDSFQIIEYPITVENEIIVEDTFEKDKRYSCAIFAVSQKGIEYININNAYKINEKITSYDKVIKNNVILDKIIGEFKNIDTTDRLEINNLDFRLYPVLKNKKEQIYELIPVWLVRGKQEFISEKGKEKKKFQIFFSMIYSAIDGTKK